MWRIPFGKYKGETLETVMGEDPNYLIWLVDNTDVDIHSSLLDELDEAYRTAKGILFDKF